MEKRIGILLIMLHLYGCVEGSNLIQEIKVEGQRVSFKINSSLKKRFLAEDFFVEYDKNIDLKKIPESILILPLVLNIFSTVWASGETYYLDSLDYDIYHGLKKLKKIYKELYPRAQWKGQLIPRRAVATKPVNVAFDEKLQTSVLFDGRLDAYFTSLTLKDKKQLLLTVGGKNEFRLPQDGQPDKSKNRFQEYAQTQNFENAFIRSNFDTFLNTETLNTLSPQIPDWKSSTIGAVGEIGIVLPVLFAQGYSVLHVPTPYNGSIPNCFVSILKCANIRIENDPKYSTILEKVTLLTRAFEERSMMVPLSCQQGFGEDCEGYSPWIPLALGLYSLGKDPQQYGYTLSSDDLQLQAMNYLSKPFFSRTEAENLVRIQKELQQKLSNEDVSTKKLSWINGIDIKVSEYASTHQLLYPEEVMPVAVLDLPEEKNVLSLEEIIPDVLDVPQKDVVSSQEQSIPAVTAEKVVQDEGVQDVTPKVSPVNSVTNSEQSVPAVVLEIPQEKIENSKHDSVPEQDHSKSCLALGVLFTGIIASYFLLQLG